MNVLLVDDDTVDRMAIKRALGASPREINLFEAANIADSERVLSDQSVDVVLLDYRLGAEDGLEWLRRGFLNQRPAMAVVMISSAEDEELACRCLEAGAQDFLPKNEITPGRLMRALVQARIRYNLETEVRDSHNRLRNLAERDSLTGLANRFHFEEQLRLAVERGPRGEEHLALIAFDLDRFKTINDRYGHDVGDGLLREVADRLRRTARESDLLARMGGDEFVVLPRGLDSLASAARLAERVRDVMSEPVRFGSLTLRCEASIGIATYPDSGETAEELYKSADLAMYRAKQEGRNRVCFFSAELQAQMTRQVRLEEDLIEAERSGQLLLHYQPQITPGSNDPVSFEALLRWQHPRDGLKGPDEFLAVAEETGRINSIGAWILWEACRALAAHNRDHGGAVSVAVNISAVQLGDGRLVEHVEAALAESGLAPELLELELTETTLLERPEEASSQFSRLAEMGVHLVLDDFGIGYSSLSHIREFPIDTLKVDKTFLWRAMKSDRDMRLLRAVVSMATTMELTVVVEGVETEEQLRLCTELGAHRVQGYLIARPAPLEEVTV